MAPWGMNALNAFGLASFTLSPRLIKLQRIALAGCIVLSACGGGAGLSPSSPPAQAAPPAVLTPTLAAADLAVLIAAGDPLSEAIGLAYQQARGIADAHVIRLAVPRGSDSISAADFATLKASLDSKLPATAQALLLTWTQPSRVVGACSMGITSALTLGYDVKYCGGCVLTQSSPYYNTDTRRPFTDLKLRPSMMLGAATLAEAQTLIARGVAADGAALALTASTPQAFLVRTADVARSVRYPDFQSLAAAGLQGVKMNYIDNSDSHTSNEISGQTDVMFYLTGLSQLSQAASNRYLPGAAADTLTSSGGALPDGYGQMPITDWLKAGATASYGTVEEPCNFTQKFSRASVLASRYRRGETLIEAYWKSVQAPGQGLFVGEPLARPWATR